MKKSISLLILICTIVALPAQSDTNAVKTIEGITNKMLELISGPQGEERNWDEYRQLFLPRAQKITVNLNAPQGRQVRAMNIEEFIRTIGPYYARDGFEEYTIGLEINEFNGIANVFQSFYCRNLIGTYEKRGVNSYQLVFADDRWWIASTTFTNETDENLLPQEWLFEEFKN